MIDYIVSAIVLALTGLVTKYLLPLLATQQRLRYAQFIAYIADDVTDELAAKYPEKEWLRYLDEAIDKVIEICGLQDSSEVAKRAVNAAIARKESGK